MASDRLIDRIRHAELTTAIGRFEARLAAAEHAIYEVRRSTAATPTTPPSRASRGSVEEAHAAVPTDRMRPSGVVVTETTLRPRLLTVNSERSVCRLLTIRAVGVKLMTDNC
jgi:hypothetical protein